VSETRNNKIYYYWWQHKTQVLKQHLLHHRR